MTGLLRDKMAKIIANVGSNSVIPIKEPVVEADRDVAMIDPEDYQLNTLVNERNYRFRHAMYSEESFIDMSWVDDFESTLPLSFASLDRATDNKKRMSTFGIRVHDLNNALIVTFVSHTHTCYFHVWSNDNEVCKFWLDAIRYKYIHDKVEDAFDAETNSRIVTFWGATSHGYNPTERKITLLDWDDHVVHNYPPSVKNQLQILHDLTSPVLGGRIILMHGEPGTGKTSLIRTLSKKWTNWCHISYITDPEVLFGNAGALMSVLAWDFSRYIKAGTDETEAYHLIVIEDAGELLEKDASGQGFARLLNMADGLLAQSTNLLICITTNKDIHDIHPAIARPGRCLANIYFEEFTRDEARGWLENYNPERFEELDAELTKAITTPGHSVGVTLAELYHIVSTHKQIVKPREEVVHGQYL